MTVFRVEAGGEEPTPYPSLWAAMCEAPSGEESQIVRDDGVVLTESQASGTRPRFSWRATVAGQRVLDASAWGVAS